MHVIQCVCFKILEKIENYMKIIVQLVDAAEIIQTRASEINEGKSEYYVHYEGCKFVFILINRKMLQYKMHML